jgi:hypothetical protein
MLTFLVKRLCIEPLFFVIAKFYWMAFYFFYIVFTWFLFLVIYSLFYYAKMMRIKEGYLLYVSCVVSFGSDSFECKSMNYHLYAILLLEKYNIIY